MQYVPPVVPLVMWPGLTTTVLPNKELAKQLNLEGTIKMSGVHGMLQFSMYFKSKLIGTD